MDAPRLRRELCPNAGEKLSKALQDSGRIAPCPFDFDDLFKSQDGGAKAAEDSARNTSKSTAKSGGGYRWITVHPHGEEHGVPIRIKENNDGSYSVAGGAGGKLNGLRLTGVKSPEEYKRIASEKAKVRREKEQADKNEKFGAIKDSHKESLQKEAQESGKTLSDKEVPTQ